MLFDALSVTQDDDVWARWLETEMAAWRSADTRPWQLRPLSVEWPSAFADGDAHLVSFPAKQFVRDRVPSYVFRTQREFGRCRSCDRVYWRGTHVEHVIEALSQAAREDSRI